MPENGRLTTHSSGPLARMLSKPCNARAQMRLVGDLTGTRSTRQSLC